MSLDDLLFVAREPEPPDKGFTGKVMARITRADRYGRVVRRGVVLGIAAALLGASALGRLGTQQSESGETSPQSSPTLEERSSGAGTESQMQAHRMSGRQESNWGDTPSPAVRDPSDDSTLGWRVGAYSGGLLQFPDAIRDVAEHQAASSVDIVRVDVETTYAGGDVRGFLFRIWTLSAPAPASAASFSVNWDFSTPEWPRCWAYVDRPNYSETNREPWVYGGCEKPDPDPFWPLYPYEGQDFMGRPEIRDLGYALEFEIVFARLDEPKCVPSHQNHGSCPDRYIGQEVLAPGTWLHHIRASSRLDTGVPPTDLTRVGDYAPDNYNDGPSYQIEES